MQVGNIELFRPRPEAEVLARHKAERHLRGEYTSGRYTDALKINEILQYQFEYFHSKLRTEIVKSASLDLITFLMTQYDASSRIEDLYKSGRLPDADETYWEEQGPTIRRSLKYLAELITSLVLCQLPRLARDETRDNLEAIIISCERLVESYVLSDQTYGLHPNDTSFTVLPEGELLYWELDVACGDRFSDLMRRIRLDAQRRSRYINGTELGLDLDFQSGELDSAFYDEFGFTYHDAVQFLKHLIDTAVVCDGDRFDVPFVRRESIVDALHEDKGWPKESVELLLSGFSVTKAAMEKEGRAIYRPQQEYRAFRRGFFEMPHETGVHLLWSRTMARECLKLLIDATVFQRLPLEWQKPRTRAAAAKLQMKAGHWFEMQVDRCMSSLGSIGRRSLKTHIGVAVDRVAIPSDIGEIDYLGYFPTPALLVVVEAKMVDCGMEPRYLRDDMSSFVTGRKPHVEQLRRKVHWVRNNVAKVCSGLSSIIPDRPSISPKRVAGALITLYPTYASYSITDYPCVALSELMTAHGESGQWPYDAGMIIIK